MNKVVKKFKKLFPEEVFYAGLKDGIDMPSSDEVFIKKFEKHLDYYERNIFPLTSEKLYKSAIFMFYSMAKGIELNESQLKIINGFLESSKDGMTVADKKAYDYFIDVCGEYNEFTDSEKIKLSNGIKLVNESKIFDKDIDYKELLSEIFGMDALSEDFITDLIHEYNKKIVSESTDITVKDVSIEQIQKVVDVICKKMEIECLNVEFNSVPNYMDKEIPLAAAYCFNRTASQNFEFKVFINLSKEIGLPKLLLVLGHEVFGHILHFNLVQNYCMDEMKKLPYLSRFPMTEGVALLAEDMILELFEDGNLVQYLLEIFGVSDSRMDDFKDSLKQNYYSARILRLSRYLFEKLVYVEKTEPSVAAGEISKIIPFSLDGLKTDLFSFLYVPGYGSCYFGGYNMLKDKLNLLDKTDRILLGKFGFNFISEFKKT